MVCQKCGGETIHDTKKMRENHDKKKEIAKDKLKDKSCEELIGILQNPQGVHGDLYWPYEREAAKEILKERGHKE